MVRPLKMTPISISLGADGIERKLEIEKQSLTLRN